MDANLASDIAYYLNGSANTEAQAAELFKVTEEEISRAAEIESIGCCAGCGWWDEVGALDGDQNCEDCSEDQ